MSCRRNSYANFPRNSEAVASEFLENLERNVSLGRDNEQRWKYYGLDDVITTICMQRERKKGVAFIQNLFTTGYSQLCDGRFELVKDTTRSN